MNRTGKFISIICLCLQAMTSVAGNITTYTDQAIFDGLYPGLPVEDFEEAMVAPNSAVGCSPPISSISNDACFAPGDIVPGLSIIDLPGPNADGIAAFGVGWVGLPSKMVAPNLAIDRISLTFDPPVNAVGFFLHTWGANDPDTPDVSLFDESDVLIDTISANSSVAGDFLGVFSETLIKRIEVFSAVNSPEAVDEIRFGLILPILEDGFENPAPPPMVPGSNSR